MASLVTDHVFEFDSLQEEYKHICEVIVYHGQEISPRGMRTRELLCPTLVLHRPHDALPTGIGRGVSLKVAAVEAIQLCGAFHDPELMVAASSHFEQFREPHTGQMHGAYGHRIFTQTSTVVRKLKADPGSRQAVITLWDTRIDNLPDRKDYPCTVSLQFLIRNDKLICATNMRSNDVWLGLAYDLFQFGQLQWTIANMLGCEVGSLIHRPASLHLYEPQWTVVDDLSDTPRIESRKVYGFKGIDRAKRIGYDRIREKEPLTSSESWYVEQLAPLFERKRERHAREAT